MAEKTDNRSEKGQRQINQKISIANLGQRKTADNQKQRKIQGKKFIAEHQQKMRNSHVAGNFFNLWKNRHYSIVANKICPANR